MKPYTLLIAAAVWLMLAPNAAAQARATGADVEGTVVDQVGGVLVGARIEIVNLETNVARRAITDSTGRFVAARAAPRALLHHGDAPWLPSGNAERHRAVPWPVAHARVRAELAPVTETVAVEVEAPVLQVNRTEMSSVINQQQIDTLPINGRNFISFSVITPGVATDRTPQQGATTTSRPVVRRTARRAPTTSWSTASTTTTWSSARCGRTFSQEAVREFQVLTNSYSAEFGKASGGVVNIVTKSGTNDFHGNAFFYFRDETLNAKKHFEKFDIFGNPVDLREGAVRPEAMGRDARRPAPEGTRRSSSCPSSGPTSRTTGS